MITWRLSACAVGTVLVSIGCATAREPAGVRSASVERLATFVEPVRGEPSDYDRLVELVGDNRFVLLGEATHGTREFYQERARLTRRLIEEKGFTVVAIEADWPDAYDVNEFIHGRGPSTAGEALRTFDRFPTWMWGNDEFRELVDWLRDYNRTAAGQDAPVGLYGIDLYSVTEATGDVIAFLERDDPQAARRAKERYKCFDRYRGDAMQEYGRDVAHGVRRSCSDAATAQLQELTQRAVRDGEGHRPGDDRLVSAWQSARVVSNGEAYYRTMYAGGVAAWNLRDRHMADTIDVLSRHLNEGARRPAKLVVWAHNSHLGDARVTERSELGELNVGQLMRQRHDGKAVLVGFTTYGGRVRAASDWGGTGRDQRLIPAVAESFSALFHETGIPAFSLRLRGSSEAAEALGGRRLERFVGVVYMPATERRSHYFEVELAKQFDAIVHIDQTTAVQPISERPPK